MQCFLAVQGGGDGKFALHVHVLHPLEGGAHQFARRKRPRTVLDDRRRPALEILGFQAGEEVLHRGEQPAVVRAGGEHRFVAAERVCNGEGKIFPREVAKIHLFAPFFENGFQAEHSLLRVPVDGRARDERGFFFGAVGAPRIVFFKIVKDICGMVLLMDYVGMMVIR